MSEHSKIPGAGENPRYDPGDYERPSVTVDIVLLTFRDDELRVLLVRRKHWPYADHWAVPGGFVNMTETLEEAAQRELFEETAVSGVQLEQLHTFGDPGRDPRMRVISVAYFALLDPRQIRPIRGGDDAAEARWWPIRNLPPLAFDHALIVQHAIRRLRWKLHFTTLGRLLLPETFPMAQLQAVFEQVPGQRLDSATLQRILLATCVLEPAGEPDREGIQRYRFSPKATDYEKQYESAI